MPAASTTVCKDGAVTLNSSEWRRRKSKLSMVATSLVGPYSDVTSGTGVQQPIIAQSLLPKELYIIKW
ncbi:hypothetical protein [Tenacibaculum aiptasiae]|uniref:hypothetical protein n=1 Tax=Tenacibaculum aiptasiae TaxID=426481 RepID=UPI003B5B84D3